MRHPYSKPAVMQKLHLSIPDPCHENWHHMTPTQQGRYCNACAKEVVDFSMMTDTEVLNYFTRLTHEKVCGRALPAQLNRTIFRPKEPKKRLFWYWNYLLMFFMFFSKANTVKSQGGIRTVTELSPVKPAVDNIGEPAMASWVVKGNVTDIDGNPVSFASIKIKGTRYGISADANGSYSIKVKPNDILLVAGASFRETEVAIGTQRIINIILDYGYASGLMEIVVAGRKSMNNSKHVAVLNVKDDETRQPVGNAKIIVIKGSNNDADTVLVDKKGEYKLKGLKGNEEYFIKVEAEGYGVSEFTINADNFKDKKKNWEVLLTRQLKELPGNKPPARKNCPGATVLLGAVSVIANSSEPLYVVDGTIMPGSVNINPDDVEEYSILKGPEATALFGPDGSNGAIVITTRKAKAKTLDSVTVISDFGTRRVAGMVGAVSVVKKISAYNEVKARINTLLTDSIRIFPDPVQRGNAINVSLKLKQAGIHTIQIADASGRIMLQKQITATVNGHTEKIIADSKWSGGVYYIRVFDDKNQLISKSSFIVR